MDQFEYVMVLVSIIIGLGIARIHIGGSAALRYVLARLRDAKMLGKPSEPSR